MNDSKTVFLISGTPNPRIDKRIDLAKNYCSVHLVFWNRLGATRSYEDNRCILHGFCRKTKNSIIHRLPYYKAFSKYALKQLDLINPSIIHTQGLDMLSIAFQYAKKHKVTLIYEVPDIPHLLIDKPKNFFFSLFQKYLNKLEKKCLSLVDLLIVTSPSFLSIRYCALIDMNRTFYFANVPEKAYLTDYRRKANNKKFTIGFIGAVRYKQQMISLLECAKHIDATFLIAGYEIDGNEIEILAKSISNVVWYGEYSFSKDGAKLYGECDVVYAVYDADMKNVQVALPNKLYESIYCELPIIVAKGTYLAEVVEQWGVGVTVDCHNQKELQLIINKLKNDQKYYEFLVENCRNYKKETELSTYNDRLVSRIEEIMLSKKKNK